MPCLRTLYLSILKDNYLESNLIESIEGFSKAFFISLNTLSLERNKISSI